MASELFVTIRDLNRATLARQMLLGRERIEPLRAIERLVGLQAQWPKPPHVGLWSRVEAFARKDLLDLLRKRAAVRATMMRGTIHVVSARDFVALRPPLQPMLDRSMAQVLRGRMAGIDVARGRRDRAKASGLGPADLRAGARRPGEQVPEGRRAGDGVYRARRPGARAGALRRPRLGVSHVAPLRARRGLARKEARALARSSTISCSATSRRSAPPRPPTRRRGPACEAQGGDRAPAPEAPRAPRRAQAGALRPPEGAAAGRGRGRTGAAPSRVRQPGPRAHQSPALRRRRPSQARLPARTPRGPHVPRRRLRRGHMERRAKEGRRDAHRRALRAPREEGAERARRRSRTPRPFPRTRRGQARRALRRSIHNRAIPSQSRHQGVVAVQEYDFLAPPTGSIGLTRFWNAFSAPVIERAENLYSAGSEIMSCSSGRCDRAAAGGPARRAAPPRPLVTPATFAFTPATMRGSTLTSSRAARLRQDLDLARALQRVHRDERVGDRWPDRRAGRGCAG